MADLIALIMVDANGGRLTFRVKDTVTIGKLKETWATKKGVSVGSVVLEFNGERLENGSRVADYGLEDRAEINIRIEGDGENVRNGAAAAGNDVKPNVQTQGGESMAIRVRMEEGQLVTLRLKPSQKLSAALKAYCKHKNLDPNDHQLRFEGEFVNLDDTIEALDIQDGDILDCINRVHGGSGEDVKPQIPILIKVRDEEGQISFKLKPTTSFEKLRSVYCQQRGNIPTKEILLLIDGERVASYDSTLGELGVEDGDLLAAVRKQVGGGGDREGMTQGSDGFRVIVRDNEGKVTFRIKPDTTIGKLRATFAKTRGIAFNKMRLVFNGEMLMDEVKPFELERDEGAEDCVSLDAVVMVRGG